MTTTLITGKGGTPHITSGDMGAMQAGVIGNGSYLLQGADGKFPAVTTWTRKISCYLCCFFGGCHWLPRRMKYQERPYNRTPLHSREAGREQTKTPQHIPFRLFIPRCRFRCILRFQKNAIHIGLTGFAESTVMRYLFCIEGASSPGDAYALSMATTLVLLGLAILPESGVPADANAWKDLI